MREAISVLFHTYCLLRTFNLDSVVEYKFSSTQILKKSLRRKIEEILLQEEEHKRDLLSVLDAGYPPVFFVITQAKLLATSVVIC